MNLGLKGRLWLVNKDMVELFIYMIIYIFSGNVWFFDFVVV